jgi:hypothetical protein
VIQCEWWLLDMTLVLNGDISSTLGFLLAGMYGSAACMGYFTSVGLVWHLGTVKCNTETHF